jgi:hypothetical protein
MIAPGVIREMSACQKKANLTDAQMREVLASGLRGLLAPMQFFTRDEIVDIILWERDKNEDALKKIFSKAKGRFDLQNPTALQGK